MNNDWYNFENRENWYAPMQDYSTSESKKLAYGENREKKKNKGRIIGLCLILIVAISSAILSGGLFPGISFSFHTSSSIKGDENDNGFSFGFGSKDEAEDKENMPESFEDFFENYYSTIETQAAEIGIKKEEIISEYDVVLQSPKDEELTLQEIYKKCALSVVGIEGYSDENSSGFNWGTGVVFSEDGLIITNTHVINGCSSAKVTLFDDTCYEASLVGADSISDIAVLKINAKNLIPAEFGESSCVSVGDKVAAIGNPLGNEFRCTLTDGIISAIERGISYNGRNMSLIQTNTALNEGNSGGALFNMYGQVIGITNMKMMSSYSSIEGIGFAIPSSTVKSVAESLLRFGEVLGRPSIGITVGVIPENISDYYEIPEGLYISGVSEGSSAEENGILPGDILIKVNGETVTTTDDVITIKDACFVGDEMSLTVWRKGETLEITITLVETNTIYN